jgi:APA family basic amino acid/polyamine antiporter
VPADRVGSASAEVIFPGVGATLMAAAIMVSTFGCNNGLIFSGPRAYYAMAKDGLFFEIAGKLNKFHVPAWAIVIQGIWACFYVLPRTVRADGTYGNLYGDLLTYVISAALIFYILAIAAVFVLRAKQPDAERPYKAVGYPLIPALYVIGAAVILVVLFVYQTTATWPGLLIVLTGVPVYFIWRNISGRQPIDEL